MSFKVNFFLWWLFESYFPAQVACYGLMNAIGSGLKALQNVQSVGIKGSNKPETDH